MELHSFQSNTAKDSEIEEYHEISHGVMETTFSPKNSINAISGFDFFVQHEVKNTRRNTKKKKVKRKDKSSNLMDIINTELASAVVPIQENDITKVDYTKEVLNSYLESTSRIHNVFQKFRPRYLDMESGHKIGSNSLNPVYPRVLENTVATDTTIPVHYTPPTYFNELVSQYAESGFKHETKFLDIQLKDIKPKHHHQFSLENILSITLRDFYKEYVVIQRNLKELSRSIKISRETKDSLKRDFLKASPNKKDDLRFDQVLRKYTEELFKGKEKYVNVLQEEREIIHKIISLWSDIESVRDKTKDVETPIILITTKKKLNDEEYDREWNDIFNTELNDMIDKMEYEYVTRYIEYKETKTVQNLDDSAKRKISKPKLHIDEDTLKQEVEKLVNKMLSQDKIELILKEDNNILTESKKAFKSGTRYKYHFEIFIDDVFVCESEHIVSKIDNHTDVIEFSESLSVEILPKNTYMTLVLLENDRSISNLSTSLTEIKSMNSVMDYHCEKFVSNDIISPTFRNVGSGHNIKEIASENQVRLRSSNIFKGNLYTTFEVNIKIGWSSKLSSNHSELIKSSMDVGRKIKRLLHGIDEPNTEAISDIISSMYGRDISNDNDMIENIRSICCKFDIKTEDAFNLDKNSPELLRLKLLHLRNVGGFTNVENKLVPIHASQISTEHLNCLQKSDETDLKVQYDYDKYADMDPIELQRFIGSKYIQKLNQNVVRNLNEHLMRKTHRDVVRDFRDFSIRSIFSNNYLAPRSRIASGSKDQLLRQGIAGVQEISVAISRAINLPGRSPALVEDEEGEVIAGFKVHPLRPYVRVSYGASHARSAAAAGRHPTWNQTVKLSARLEPLSSLLIEVCDEVATTAVPSGTGRRGCRLGSLSIPLYSVLTAGTVQGTFKLTVPPIIFGYESSMKEPSNSLVPEVTRLMKQDGSYLIIKVSTSLLHLGGLQEYYEPVNSEDDYVIKHLNTFVAEYINDFPSRNLSLTFIDSSGRNKCVTQFLQPIPVPDFELFPKNSKRSESAVSKSSVFSRSSSSSKRKEDTDKSSQSGEERESLYSAYEGGFRSGESQLMKIMDLCLRYVSLIPTYEVMESHCVTLMGVEVLKVMQGSALDHALLLASMFLHLGVRCFMAPAGAGAGAGAYVLVRYDVPAKRVEMISDAAASSRGMSTWYVWDAAAGARSEARAAGCPLRAVSYVFDCDNIWVNIQSSQACESVSFDFNKSSDWQPVFTKSVFVMKLSPAVEPLYAAAAPCERLKRALEDRVREKFQRWRPRVRTVWNRYCSSVLREVLPALERRAGGGGSAGGSAGAGGAGGGRQPANTRLKQLMLTYKMTGFPINMPYSGTKSVLAAVKAANAHACTDPTVEFGLAVEMYSYPNNVISVWVFVAGISRI